MPPQNSPHFHNNIFEELEDRIINYSSKGHILLLGNFNGIYTDLISKEGNNYIKNNETET